MLTSVIFKVFSTPLERAYFVSYSSVIVMSASKCFSKGEKPLCLYRTKGTYGESGLLKRLLNSFLLSFVRAYMTSFSMVMLIFAWKCIEICQNPKLKISLYYRHPDISDFLSFFTPLERAYVVSYSSVIVMPASKCFLKCEKPLRLYRTKGTYGEYGLVKRLLNCFFIPFATAYMTSCWMIMHSSWENSSNQDKTSSHTFVSITPMLTSSIFIILLLFIAIAYFPFSDLFWLESNIDKSWR